MSSKIDNLPFQTKKTKINNLGRLKETVSWFPKLTELGKLLDSSMRQWPKFLESRNN